MQILASFFTSPGLAAALMVSSFMQNYTNFCILFANRLLHKFLHTLCKQADSSNIANDGWAVRKFGSRASEYEFSGSIHKKNDANRAIISTKFIINLEIWIIHRTFACRKGAG